MYIYTYIQCFIFVFSSAEKGHCIMIGMNESTASANKKVTISNK